MLSMTADDYNRSYSGCVLGIRTDDKIVPALVDSARGSPPEVTFVRDDRSFRLLYDHPSIVYEYPDLGIVKVRGTVYWLERQARRQWHKGVKLQLVSYRRLGGSRAAGNLGSVGNFYEILDKVYNRDCHRYLARIDGNIWYKWHNVCKEDEIDSLEIDWLRDYIKSAIREGSV